MSAGVRLLCEDEVMVLMLNKEADVMELMTLDEHIKKAEEDAENCRQLVEWLKDYKRLLECESCKDAISRQAAIDAVIEWYGCEPRDIDNFKKILAKQSSAQPERKTKTGHWIFDDECKEHGHCSYCGYGSVDLVDGEPHNFCSNCGAKMVESEE